MDTLYFTSANSISSDDGGYTEGQTFSQAPSKPENIQVIKPVITTEQDRVLDVPKNDSEFLELDPEDESKFYRLVKS